MALAMVTARGRLGRQGEALAREYLIRRGCQVLGQNVRLGRHEVDLIVRDGNDVVFVEVKTRASDRFGEPEAAVTRRQLAHLERAIAVYVQAHQEVRRVRFDVIAVRWAGAGERPQLRHLRAVGEGATLAFL